MVNFVRSYLVESVNTSLAVTKDTIKERPMRNQEVRQMTTLKI